MGVYLAQFTPFPDICALCGVRETLAHIQTQVQVTAPLSTPPELLVEVLAALLPSPIKLCLHKVVGPPRHPPPGYGQDGNLQDQGAEVG